MLKEFGIAVRNERLAHEIPTQFDLAIALSKLPTGSVDVSPSTIGHIESGRRNTGAVVFDALARLFGWGPVKFRRMHTLSCRDEEIVAHDAGAAWDVGVRR